MNRLKEKVILIIALALAMYLAAGPALAQPEPKLKVLSYNVWGIVGAKQRTLRAVAIGKKIAELDPDVVAIQEAFNYRHRDILFDSMKEAGYEWEDSVYFRDMYGSGILLISKYPMEKVLYEPYRLTGGPFYIEWLGGKGIAHVRLDTPWGLLDFFDTHAIARMDRIFDEDGNFIPGDRHQPDRLLNMYQIDRYVRGQRNRLGRSVLVAGDYNVSPQMLEYDFLKAKSGFESAYEAVHPGENQSTYSLDNNWVTLEASRIDHVMFKNYDGEAGFWLKPTEARVELMDPFTSPKKKQVEEVNYSDHFAMYAEFEVVTDGQVTPSQPGLINDFCDCEACSLTGYCDGTLDLNEANIKCWQNYALDVYARAYQEQDRNNPLLIPMAEIIAGGGDDKKVIFSPEAIEKMEKLGCKCQCVAGLR